MNYKNNSKRLELEEKEKLYPRRDEKYIPKGKKISLGEFLRLRKNKIIKENAIDEGVIPYILSDEQKLKDEEKIIKNRERRESKYGFKLSIKEALKLTYQMFLFKGNKKE